MISSLAVSGVALYTAFPLYRGRGKERKGTLVLVKGIRTMTVKDHRVCEYVWVVVVMGGGEKH